MDPYSMGRLAQTIHDESVSEGRAWKAPRWDDTGRVSAPAKTRTTSSWRMRFQTVTRSLIAALIP